MKVTGSRKEKGASSASFFTMWYVKFWAKILDGKVVPRDILENFLKIQFVGLKYASPRTHKALAGIPDSALAKISSMFLSCYPLRKLCPIVVNLGFFYDRMIEYSRAVSLPIGKREISLDIGSGYSIFPSYLAIHSHVVSVDVERATVTFQKRAAKAMGNGVSERVECVRADSSRFPFIDDSFDRIFVISTIEHVELDSSLARESGRTLKVGGQCFLSFPFSLSMQEPMINPYFQRSYTKEMMLERIVNPSMLSLQEFSTALRTSIGTFLNMVPGWFVLKDLALFSSWSKLEMSLFKGREGTLALVRLIKHS